MKIQLCLIVNYVLSNRYFLFNQYFYDYKSQIKIILFKYCYLFFNVMSANIVTNILNIRDNYSSLDGLRAYASVGIVIMHVQANMIIKPSENFVTQFVIPWFTNFTLLFMIISAFSMCCGYYERVKNGTVTPAQFYAKRYHRLWPFFAMMVLISFLMEPSWSTFCQSFANLTMCFNLLPNPHIEVIGIGWFLGTVFTFYMLFPFFTFLLDSKRRGWMVLSLSLVFYYITTTYFSRPDLVVVPINRVNIIYSAPFFLAGGMIYLYRHAIKEWVERHFLIALVLCVLFTIFRFFAQFPILFELVVFSIWSMYAIGTKNIVLNNKIVKYLSSISMEIYLCHMMFYRIVSMLHIERFIRQCDILYILTVTMTLVGTICFSHIVKFYVFPFWGKKIEVLKS